jgi:coenzyme F420-reducing hydrogenase beta subunit
MIDQLRETCRRLLADGRVDVVIGYGESGPGRAAHPVFIRKAGDVGQLVWNDRCFANLAMCLKRPEVRSLGRPAVVVKGCDERAIIQLERESQVDRGNMVVIGVACSGVGNPPEPKCAVCETHVPRFADEVIGTPVEVKTAPEAGNRFARLEVFMQRTPAERMEHWSREFERCVKCYACRQVCPLCYCERCIVDKNRPQAIDTSPTLKGNFAWQITRAFHLAARCVGCDECTRVCPAGIDLRLLNMALARAAEQQFGYRAGMDPGADPVVGAYSLQDKEDFIG